MSGFPSTIPIVCPRIHSEKTSQLPPAFSTHFFASFSVMHYEKSNYGENQKGTNKNEVTLASLPKMTIYRLMLSSGRIKVKTRQMKKEEPFNVPLSDVIHSVSTDSGTVLSTFCDRVRSQASPLPRV